MRKEFLPLARPYITDSETAEVSAVLKSGRLTTGPKVVEFERRIEEYIGGAVAAVALNSCTAGLFLALQAYGIGNGDEVVIPTWTFVATGHTVLWTGAKVVLCDVDEESLNIDIDKMEKLITPRTKAIVPVHFAGYPCDMDAIDAIARKHNLLIIQDAAHAVGTKYKGRKIGTFDNITVFSFYATKNLTCGEGGAVVSKDTKTVERIRKMSYFGIRKEVQGRYEKTGSWYYEVEELGYKYNMDDIHAAIGIVQLTRLDEMNERRKYIASLYKKNLDARIRFTEDNPNHYHTYHLFPIRIDNKIIKRDDFIKKLSERNIGSSVHFIPLHKHPFYKNMFKAKDFPVANKAYEEVVSIPMFPTMSDEDVYYVIENINDILERR